MSIVVSEEKIIALINAAQAGDIGAIRAALADIPENERAACIKNQFKIIKKNGAAIWTFPLLAAVRHTQAFMYLYEVAGDAICKGQMMDCALAAIRLNNIEVVIFLKCYSPALTRTQNMMTAPALEFFQCAIESRASNKMIGTVVELFDISSVVLEKELDENGDIDLSHSFDRNGRRISMNRIREIGRVRKCLKDLIKERKAKTC